MVLYSEYPCFNTINYGNTRCVDFHQSCCLISTQMQSHSRLQLCVRTSGHITLNGWLNNVSDYMKVHNILYSNVLRDLKTAIPPYSQTTRQMTTNCIL